MLGAISCLVVSSNMAKTLSVRLQWRLVLCLQLIIGCVILMLIAAIHSLLFPSQYHSAWDTLSLLNGAGLAWLIILNTMVAYSLYVWLLSSMTVVEFTCAGISNPIAVF